MILETSPFNPPANLAGKASPSLTADDESRSRAVAASLARTRADVAAQPAAARREHVRLGQAAVERGRPLSATRKPAASQPGGASWNASGWSCAWAELIPWTAPSPCTLDASGPRTAGAAGC